MVPKCWFHLKAGGNRVDIETQMKRSKELQDSVDIYVLLCEKSAATDTAWNHLYSKKW